MSTKSWLPIPQDSPFSLANIPFGVVSSSIGTHVDEATSRHPAVAIGEHTLNLHTLASHKGFDALKSDVDFKAVFQHPTLNAFASLPVTVRLDVRKHIQSLLAVDTPYAEILKDNEEVRRAVLVPLREVKTHLPFDIGDYTDFYAGFNHASNCSKLFNFPLHPNYHHLPTAYHGRASSVVISGTPIRRPLGQYLLDPSVKEKVPTFSASRRLDYELEFGAFVCAETEGSEPPTANSHGEPLPISKAEKNIFGYVLMNDWSARDIQIWEMPPLGPFNSKNFGTTISPWVVVPEALEPFRCKGQENNTPLQPYLKEQQEKSMYDVDLLVDITSGKTGKTTTIAKSNTRHLLWSFPQMLAHHTITGCPMRVGDLLGSGTLSGTEDGTEGCLLEQAKGGKAPVQLDGGEQRSFLEDGDTVTFRGVAGKEGEVVGFGECAGRIEPALKL